MASEQVAPEEIIPRGSVKDDVEVEFVLEDEQVLRPLTARMEEIADLLDRGEPIDSSCIARGVELWGQFGEQIHSRRVRRIIGLFPATSHHALAKHARPAGKKRGWGRKAPPETTPQDTAPQEFQGMLHDQSLTTERTNELRTLLSLYDGGGYGSRERLASVLKAFVVSEQAWARYEEEFVLRALDNELPPELDHKVHEVLAEASIARGELQTAVATYLNEPVTVRRPAPKGPATGRPPSASGAARTR